MCFKESEEKGGWRRKSLSPKYLVRAKLVAGIVGLAVALGPQRDPLLQYRGDWLAKEVSPGASENWRGESGKRWAKAVH